MLILSYYNASLGNYSEGYIFMKAKVSSYDEDGEQFIELNVQHYPSGQRKVVVLSGYIP